MARSDVQLMLDVKAGDEQSFALLLHRYRTPLVNFLFRMVRNREQAEDLAQEVFLRVYRARQDYVPSAKFTTWLFRIATNLALNSVRDNRYQKLEVSIDAPVSMDAEDGDERTMDVPEKHPNIEQHLVEEARRKMIRRAIDKLPEKQRAAVLLHKYEELDYAEIAKILNCSESALKSLLILAYVGGRLKVRGRLEVEKHLAECAACCLRVSEFSAVSKLLDELPLIEPSPEFDMRVHARVAAEPQPKASWWDWMRVSPRIAFAASMLLLMALWLGYRAGTPNAPNIPNNDQAMMQDLPVLEDHDVLQNFEPLKDLPPGPEDDDADAQQPQRM